jgi:hypothetical protein
MSQARTELSRQSDASDPSSKPNPTGFVFKDFCAACLVARSGFSTSFLISSAVDLFVRATLSDHERLASRFWSNCAQCPLGGSIREFVRDSYTNTRIPVSDS